MSDDLNSIQKALDLPPEYAGTYKSLVAPLVKRIKDCSARLVSINGAQGSGKSTLVAVMQAVLEAEHGIQVAVLSLDDFYLTRAERRHLSETLHPLLLTRGVPGTHDLDLAVEVLSALKRGQATAIPRFDKGCDERMPSDQWQNVPESCQLVLFEGWCNQLSPQADGDLQVPVNDLEAEQDPEGIWRRYVNEALALYQRDLFSLADYTVFLQAPGFDCVYDWRSEQESKARSAAGDKVGFMSNDELARFVRHYERLTRHALKTMPLQADCVARLDEGRAVQEVIFRD